MALPKRKLRTYQGYYELVLTPLRTFNDGPARGHQVVFFEVRRKADLWDGKDQSWQKLMCPCDLEWKWTMWHGRRQLVHTKFDKDRCPAKEYARETVRNELRAEHGARWRAMPLADAAYDIYQMHANGRYLGEHNIGMLYVQDLERLLGTTPETISFDAQKKGSSNVEIVRFDYPSAEILEAVDTLRGRKLLDLSGMILIPYQESFRFPDALHSFFATIIETPLGWPNGDAGDGTLWRLYTEISEKTGWQSGEEVFGKANIPGVTQAFLDELRERWIALLDPVLLDEESDAFKRADVFHAIAIDRWVAWLMEIRDHLREHAPLPD